MRNKWPGLKWSGGLRTVGLLLTGLLLAGCSEKSAPEPAAEARTDGKILIRGSNTIGEELAPKLITEYKKDHPSASFDLETKGTSYGMGALMGGYCDIAGASRLPSKEELEVAQFRNVELNDYVIGSYSVAVVANAANTVATLTKEQVRDIFIGTITNWNQVGGADAQIHLYIRDPDFRDVSWLQGNCDGKQTLRQQSQSIHQLQRHCRGGRQRRGWNRLCEH
ncbi:MAG: substrate-binding domain-containing protein [Limisphaerales bacterium]